MSQLPIPIVRIDEEGGHKFILARVTAPNGRARLVVWADQQCSYHRDILRKLRRSVPRGFRVECLGGGHIRTNLTATTRWYSDEEIRTGDIRLFRNSGDFGYEPRHHTIRILKTDYPHAKIHAEW